MPIQFLQIPIDLVNIGTFVEFNKDRNTSGIPVLPNRALVIGQKLSGGSATANEPILVPSKGYIGSYFGQNSQLADSLEYYFDNNRFTEVWALPVADDGGGTAAAYTITITGPATSSGTLFLRVNNKYKIFVPVVNGDAQNTIASNTKAKFDQVEDETNLMVSAGVAANVVTVTAKHKGTLCNDIEITHNWFPGETTPGGVTVAIAQSVTGATDPDITTGVSNLVNVQFTDISNPYTDSSNLGVLETELETRFNATVGLDGHSYIAVDDTYNNLVTFGTNRNSPHVTAMPAKDSPTPAWGWASALLGASTSVSDPALPRTRMELKGVSAPKPVDQLDFYTEQNTLLKSYGFSSYSVGQDGKVYIGKLITMYRKDANNIPDPSYYRHATMKVLSAIRYTFVYNFAKFVNHKLAPDTFTVVAGMRVMTPKRARNIAIDILSQMEREQAWIVNTRILKDDVIAEIDGQNPSRLLLQVPVDIIQHNDQTAILVQHKG